MENYKKALDKAVDYIMNSAEDYCSLCVNFNPCNQRLAEYGKLGTDCEIDIKICKHGLIQYFLAKGESDLDEYIENNGDDDLLF